MHESVAYIAEEIRKARKKMGITQQDLSQKTGITQAQISKIERGESDILATTLVLLARALSLEVMLVPQILKPAVETLQKGDSINRPRYQLEDSDA